MQFPLSCCSCRHASQRMEELTLGETVTLTPGAQDDVDRYGRLLRYVDVGDVDAGEVMLMSGFAIPRYNSTDGYGEHDREALYKAAYEVGEAAGKFNPCDDKPPPIIEEQEAPADGGQLLPPPASGPDLDCSDSAGLSTPAVVTRTVWTVTTMESGASEVVLSPGCRRPGFGGYRAGRVAGRLFALGPAMAPHPSPC